jgi:hypothetical protein
MKAFSENPKSSQESQWERGWDEHESLQLRRLASLSLADKLLWLEQAHRVVIQLQSGRRSDEDLSGR